MPSPSEHPQPTWQQPCPWHALDLEQVLNQLQSCREGLAEKEAARRLAQLGPNELLHLPPRRRVLLFAQQLAHPLCLLMLAAAIVLLPMAHPVHSAAIASAAVITAYLGYRQQAAGCNNFEPINGWSRGDVWLFRAGTARRQAGSAVVPGDVVRLSPGDRVQADLRVLAAQDLRADESVLTGHREVVRKHPAPLPEEIPWTERGNMLLAGSIVVSGTGRGVVVASGWRTELGRFWAEHTVRRPADTPVASKIARFGYTLAVCLLLLALAGSIYAWGVNQWSTDEVALAAVALALSAIAVAWPVAATAVASVAAGRIAAAGIRLQRPQAIEALSTVTTLCLEPQDVDSPEAVWLQQAWANGHQYFATGTTPTGQWFCADRPVGTQQAPALAELLAAALLTTHAAPEDGALLAAARKLGIDPGSASQGQERVVLHCPETVVASVERSQVGGGTLTVRGPADTVLGWCDSAPAELAQAVQWMQHAGLTVQVVARRDEAQPSEQITSQQLRQGGFTCLGVVGLARLISSDTCQALERSEQAGLEVKLVTAGSGEQAAVVARQMGWPIDQPDELTGRQLAELDASELTRRFRQGRVLSGLAPEQRLKLAQSLRNAGRVVGLSGRGLEDAPALLQADVAIASVRAAGATAAMTDLVLQRPGYARLLAAVEHARQAVANLGDAATFLLPPAVSQALLLLFGLLLAWPLAISPAQVIWVNLVMGSVLVMGLACEGPLPEVQPAGPRDRNAPLLNRAALHRVGIATLLMSAAAVSIYLWHQLALGSSAEQCSTAAITTIVLGMIFYGFACRSGDGSVFRAGLLSNRGLCTAAVAALVLQVGFVYWPWFQRLLGTGGLTWQDWAQCLVAGVLLLPVIEFVKWVQRGPPPELAPADWQPTPAPRGSTMAMSVTLDELLRVQGGQAITIGQLADHAAERGFGFVAAMLSLPFLLLPMPGLSVPFGLAVAWLGVQIAVGRSRVYLPANVRQQVISAQRFGRIASSVRRLSCKLERLVRPRWGFVLAGKLRVLVGLALMLAGILLGLPLPIPGSNVPGAFLGLLVALGLLEEDGLLAMVGTVLTIGLCAALGLLTRFGVLQLW